LRGRKKKGENACSLTIEVEHRPREQDRGRRYLASTNKNGDPGTVLDEILSRHRFARLVPDQQADEDKLCLLGGLIPKIFS